MTPLQACKWPSSTASLQMIGQALWHSNVDWVNQARYFPARSWAQLHPKNQCLCSYLSFWGAQMFLNKRCMKWFWCWWKVLGQWSWKLKSSVRSQNRLEWPAATWALPMYLKPVCSVSGPLFKLMPVGEDRLGNECYVFPYPLGLNFLF